MTSTFRMTLNQNNDETILLPFLSDDAIWPIPVGTVIEFWIKNQNSTPDADPSSIKLSTATGEVVVSNGPQGEATATVAHSHLPTSGLYWWRCDAIYQGSRKTAGCGPLQIQAV